jgi:hypothetical protein
MQQSDITTLIPAAAKQEIHFSTHWYFIKEIPRTKDPYIQKKAGTSEINAMPSRVSCFEFPHNVAAISCLSHLPQRCNSLRNFRDNPTFDQNNLRNVTPESSPWLILIISVSSLVNASPVDVLCIRISRDLPMSTACSSSPPARLQDDNWLQMAIQLEMSEHAQRWKVFRQDRS